MAGAVDGPQDVVGAWGNGGGMRSTSDIWYDEHFGSGKCES